MIFVTSFWTPFCFLQDPRTCQQTFMIIDAASGELISPCPIMSSCLIHLLMKSSIVTSFIFDDDFLIVWSINWHDKNRHFISASSSRRSLLSLRNRLKMAKRRQTGNLFTKNRLRDRFLAQNLDRLLDRVFWEANYGQKTWTGFQDGRQDQRQVSRPNRLPRQEPVRLENLSQVMCPVYKP